MQTISEIVLCKVCNLLLMVVALLVPSFYYTKRLPKELFIWGSTFILWLVPAVAFFICRFSKNSCLSLDAGSLAMQFFFFLPGKVSKQLWGVYHAPPPKGLVLMGKNLTTLLKADNIVCWIFRAIWATECFFHSLWNTYPSINDPGFNLKTPWVILSPLHVSLLIWSAVWPLDD